MTYVKQNLWQELPKGYSGFGQAEQPYVYSSEDVDKLFADQALPSRDVPVWRFGPMVGRYSLVTPQRIMWETPVSTPMSVTGNDEAAWQQGLDGFGQPSAGEAAAIGVGSILLWGLSLVVLGGVVIWVVRSIRKD